MILWHNDSEIKVYRHVFNLKNLLWVGRFYVKKTLKSFGEKNRCVFLGDITCLLTGTF